MPRIAAGVGLAQPNNPSDVKTVQPLLNRNALSSPGRTVLGLDGLCGKRTLAAIDAFQKHALHFAKPDSIVAQNGPTLRLLAAHSVAPPLRRTKPPRHPTSQPSGTPASRPHLTNGISPPIAANTQSLSDDDYVNAAHELHCEAAAIKAIAATETGAEGAFDSQGRPSILFERHYFHRLTQGRFDKSDPDISNPHAGGYGRFSDQYPKLDRAIKLDRDAALKSASWGKFQIMGDNYREAGYSSVGAFVEAENRSVQDHLSALVSYIKADPMMLRALQQKDWAGFASRYNGPQYQQNDYDTKMRNNYANFTRSP